MGDRGVSHHARGMLAARDLAKLGVRAAIVGANRSWTSFAIVGSAELDAGAMARALRVAVLQVWFDDDAGVSLNACTPDGWSAELPIELGGGGKRSDADAKLLAQLVAKKLITGGRRIAFELRLIKPARTRDAWILRHGVEAALGLPSSIALPVPLEAALLRELVPDATLIAPRKTRPPPAKGVKPAPTRSHVWTPADRAILAMHQTYWAEIFSMNGWKLYHRYKKHLPAERRREVDALCNLVATGGEIEPAVEAILGSIWDADDWLAAIRDPRLASDEGIGGDQLAGWTKLTGAR
jgi:hypothetical protein